MDFILLSHFSGPITILNMVSFLYLSNEAIPLELFNVSFPSRFTFVLNLRISLGHYMHAKPKLKPTNKANPNKEVVEKKSFRYENELCQKWIESQEQTVTVGDYILESLEHCSEDTCFCCEVHQRPEVYLATQLIFPIEVTHHNVLSIPEIVGFSHQIPCSSSQEFLCYFSCLY